jgi:23S rRNA (adenine1618-N6)-methyltransferase
MVNPRGLHPKNKHQKKYNFSILCATNPSLKEFVFVNEYKTETIDFANPKAVKELNRAILFTHYNLTYWEFPEHHLCPPIPGRVDYIHYVADILKESAIKNITVLDIGTGASCIYPILGNVNYGWRFVATDIDKKSLEYAQQILMKNGLDSEISLRHQNDKTHIFKGILNLEDTFAVTLCNPPFYSSIAEAKQENARKNKGLETNTIERNFSGIENELCYKGGEKAFLHTYLYESSQFKKQCFWYTTLVSKKENVKSMYTSLEKLGATTIKTIPMHQGNKITRIVAWTFLNEKEQKEWGS